MEHSITELQPVSRNRTLFDTAPCYAVRLEKPVKPADLMKEFDRLHLPVWEVTLGGGYRTYHVVTSAGITNLEAALAVL